MVLTEADIEQYDYDCTPDFPRSVIESREALSPTDFITLTNFENAANGNCFGTAKRITSDGKSVLQIQLYGEYFDVRSIIEMVDNTDKLLLRSMTFVDSGWEPAHLECIVVETSEGVWE